MKKTIIACCILITFLVIVWWFSGKEIKDKSTEVDYTIELQQTENNCATLEKPAEPSPAVRILDSLGLINIHEINPTIGVQLKYATTDNFTGQVLYKDLTDAYLQPDVAVMLGKAQKYLRSLYPELNLLVYDAARPLSVQQIMWDCVKDTPYRNYIAHPDKAGLHNYGAAVDLTIADSAWSPLDMGTPFDFFGKKAGTGNEKELEKQGLLNIRQVENRQLLRKVMHHAGFRSISGEWWHFNACTLNEAQKRYPLIRN